MTSAVNKIERMLLARGFRVKHEDHYLKIYTNNVRFPRSRVDEVLRIADRYGVKISAIGPFVIRRKEKC